MLKTLAQCPVSCDVTAHEGPRPAKEWDGYDVVLMHNTWKKRPAASLKKVPAHQLTGIVGLESDVDYAFDRGDFQVSFSQRSGVPINYWYGFTYDNMCAGEACLEPAYPRNATQMVQELGLDRKGVKGGEKNALSALFVSNCARATERLAYLTELKKYIQFDSYGLCLHTDGLPSAAQRKAHFDRLGIKVGYANT
jgi:hypothetical protein